MLIVCGDLNGHVGKTSDGFEGIHGGKGFGVRNSEGTRILELCAAADLVVTNTLFTKPDNHLVTYRSGKACSQIDFILVRRPDLKCARDVKVIGGEECVSQHKLLICDLELNTSFSKPASIPPKRKLWKLKEPEVRQQFEKAVHDRAQSFKAPQDPDSAWKEIKTCLLEASRHCLWVDEWRSSKTKRNVVVE